MNKTKRTISFFTLALLLMASILVMTQSAVFANSIDTRQAWDDSDDWGDDWDDWEDGDWEDEEWDDEEPDFNDDEKSGKTPATRGDQPFMVALVDASERNAFNGQSCGGSLIAPQWVLTAAHCLEGVRANELDLVIGRYTLSGNEGERISAAQIINHPQYDTETVENDIALIKLARPATAGTPINVITTATERLDDAPAMARITGWGIVPEDNFEAPDSLHGVNVPVVTQQACKSAYGADDILDTNICAGYPDGGFDSCNGDSGGPLFVGTGANATQIGIVSWGDGCGLPNAFGVYTRLTEYQNWMSQHIDSSLNSGSTTSETQPEPAPIPAASGRIEVAEVTLPNAYQLEDVYEDEGYTEAVFYSRNQYVAVITDGDTYDSLEDVYLNEGGWTQTIDGIEVYIGRYADDYGTYTEAVMVIDGQLIIVESSVSTNVLARYIGNMFN